MLLCVQRVLEPVGPDARVGTNTFRYAHETTPWPLDPRPLLDEPGELVGRRIEVRSGGNRVLSYLDLAVPEDVTPIELRDCLEAMLTRETPTAEAVWEPGSRCAMRFGLEAEFAGHWRDELRSLMSYAIR